MVKYGKASSLMHFDAVYMLIQVLLKPQIKKKKVKVLNWNLENYPLSV